jgi:hypothetical protein
MGFGRIFIGKESIEVNKDFFQEKYVSKIIDEVSAR